MSVLTRNAIKDISQIRGELLRYEASIPNAIEYLEIMLDRRYTPDASDKEKLTLYCNNLSHFLKLVHHIDGNFPFALFANDETVRLMAWGYVLLYGDRLITFAQAAKLLDITPFSFYRLMYPNKGKPALTAYYDPAERIKQHGSRALIDEVKALANKKP